jgi:hypothetical protein
MHHHNRGRHSHKIRRREKRYPGLTAWAKLCRTSGARHGGSPCSWKAKKPMSLGASTAVPGPGEGGKNRPRRSAATKATALALLARRVRARRYVRQNRESAAAA